jgi:hypothetical protein
MSLCIMCDRIYFSYLKGFGHNLKAAISVMILTFNKQFYKQFVGVFVTCHSGSFLFNLFVM